MVDRESIEQLRELAGKATPGPWKANEYDTAMGVDDSSGIYVVPVGYWWGGEACVGPTQEDAEFIAAANPQTVLALLDALVAERRLSDQLAAALDWYAHPATWDRIKTVKGGRMPSWATQDNGRRAREAVALYHQTRGDT